MAFMKPAFKERMFADVMRPLVGVGLLTSEGELWKEHRRLATSALQVRIVFAMVSHVIVMC